MRTGAPSGPLTSLRDQLAAELGQQRVERALAAVGDRAQVGRHQPGALEPAPDRARDLGGVERALERVGGDEDGTLGDGHGVGSCQRRLTHPVRLRTYPGVATNDIAGMQAAVGVL